MNEITRECDLCGTEVKFGQHLYEGKHLSHYNLFVGDCCLVGSPGEIAPYLEKAFEDHLEKNNIALPDRNNNDCYPLYPSTTVHLGSKS